MQYAYCKLYSIQPCVWGRVHLICGRPPLLTSRVGLQTPLGSRHSLLLGKVGCYRALWQTLGAAAFFALVCGAGSLSGTSPRSSGFALLGLLPPHGRALHWTLAFAPWSSTSWRSSSSSSTSGFGLVFYALWIFDLYDLELLLGPLRLRDPRRDLRLLQALRPGLCLPGPCCGRPCPPLPL